MSYPSGEGVEQTISPPDPVLVRGYRGLDGVYDEMIDADGEIRPHWRHLVNALGQRIGRLSIVALHLVEERQIEPVEHRASLPKFGSSRSKIAHILRIDCDTVLVKQYSGAYRCC